ncbi:hypothetical protein BDV93DRAFT_606319 [Ceratobasidium sp. AG-I]|nr:hypothetical protein BDV93DRAFT_606319 [Ceratobasidium sp. AG-I]
MRMSHFASIFARFYTFVLATNTTQPRTTAQTPKELIHEDALRPRYADVHLPSLHLKDLYVNAGNPLRKNLVSELLPWTRSNSFHKNSTVRPIIMASFYPFSAVDWLTFNWTTMELSGRTPFSDISSNVSVTLIPMFLNKNEEVTSESVIISSPFNSTPITFASATFSVHILSEHPENTDLRGWTPYLTLVLAVIAAISVAFMLTTCCWEYLCCCHPSCRRFHRREIGNRLVCDPESQFKHGRDEKLGWGAGSIWTFLPGVGNIGDVLHVTPYHAVERMSPTPQHANRHEVDTKPLDQDEGPSLVRLVIAETIEGVQHANIATGSPFAVEIKLDGTLEATSQNEKQAYRVHMTPYAPEWIHFCSERMVLWGTAPDILSPPSISNFEAFVMPSSPGLAVAKVNFHILDSPADRPFSEIFSGVGNGIWHECINGVDTLNILSGVSFDIKYRPAAFNGGIVNPKRFDFHCSQPLPGWLTLNPRTLGLVGNTAGYIRRDLRDILIYDRRTAREVAKLRVVLVIHGERV